MLSAQETILRRLEQVGRITFAEFLELALYSEGGYYRAAHHPASGRHGDYFTSPYAHPLFGALLALQLEQLWRLLDSPEPFHVVEPGAGDGRLARDIVAYAAHLDAKFAAAMVYQAIDRVPHPVRGEPVGPRTATRFAFADTLPFERFTGVVLSNELIDAMPIHRVAMQRGRLRELYVMAKGGRLVAEPGDLSTPELAALLADQGVRLQEGWQAEVCLAAANWMADIAQRLDRGYVLTCDYGDLAEDLYVEARRRGTLMSYFRHTGVADPLDRPGEQDITAHANFTTLIDAGKMHGLMPVTLLSQREFLGNLGADFFVTRARALGLPPPEAQANSYSMRELVRRDGLGNFRVLVQAKGVPVRGLTGLYGPEEPWLDRLATLPVPLLTPQHADLLAARRPNLAWER